jgi:hypothetical protein
VVRDYLEKVDGEISNLAKDIHENAEAQGDAALRKTCILKIIAIV